MKPVIGKLFIKALKISGIVLGVILLLLFLIPLLFPKSISNKVKELVNSRIQGELNFSEASLSFFNHFPSLTVTLHDFNLKGAAPFKKDTLLAAGEIAFGIDLSTVFKEQVQVNEIYLTDAFINIQVDKKGAANYNVYVSEPDKNSITADTSSAALKIESIRIKNSRLVYNDQSLPMLINAQGFNYTGRGDLSKAIFDLHTKMDIGLLDFYYDGRPYLRSKKIAAELITKINTNSLAFVFEKNDLMINELPVRFKGRFEFLRNGYDMDFRLRSKGTDFHNMITALPPEYLTWLDKTEVKGFGSISLALAGKYIASTNTMPSLALKVKVWNGFIAHQKTPVPLSSLYLNAEVKLPQFNTEALSFKMDSLHFNLDKDYMNAVLKLKGMSAPDIYARVNASVDLEKWQKAVGLDSLELKGNYTLNLLARGKYARGVVKRGIRKVDTVITSIPEFSLTSTFRNGYFKYAALPQALSSINFKIDADCPDNDYKNARLSVDGLNVSILNSFIRGYLKYGYTAASAVDARLESKFRLADIRTAIPMQDITLNGDLNINILSKGLYLPVRKKFPVTTASVRLNDGAVQTSYYPNPITGINIDAQLINTGGTFKTTKVAVKPISFIFEGLPFWLKADLQNLDDLRYNVSSKGTINIGKIYRVFAVKGLNVKGKIQTDLALAGRQSDAARGRYNRLHNSGTLKADHVSVSSDLFPKPLFIQQGNFRFVQDKIRFETFRARYGSSSLVLNGALNNVINYVLNEKAPLKGDFDLKSQFILVDEFMAFAGETAPASSGTGSGVVIVPDNLELNFSAKAGKVQYQGLDLDNFEGNLAVSGGKLKLKDTGFRLIGAPVSMNAGYGSLSPVKAWFDYQIKATDFDIKKAYKEVKLFRDMASAAEHAEGIVSLEYKLSGKLDKDMAPVYPSLKGEGVLSVKHVKMKGFKLFNAVSNKTDHGAIKDPDLSKVDIKTKIANNIITIERTKMKVAGFRPRIEGQVNFDGRMNLNFRLGLPPFGILGIPISVTGTQENPKIRLGRGNKEDQLGEVSEEN